MQWLRFTWVTFFSSQGKISSLCSINYWNKTTNFESITQCIPTLNVWISILSCLRMPGKENVSSERRHHQRMHVWFVEHCCRIRKFDKKHEQVSFPVGAETLVRRGWEAYRMAHWHKTCNHVTSYNNVTLWTEVVGSIGVKIVEVWLLFLNPDFLKCLTFFGIKKS